MVFTDTFSRADPLFSIGLITSLNIEFTFVFCRALSTVTDRAREHQHSEGCVNEPCLPSLLAEQGPLQGRQGEVRDKSAGVLSSSLTGEEANMGAGVVAELDHQKQGEENHWKYTSCHRARRQSLAEVPTAGNICFTVIFLESAEIFPSTVLEPKATHSKQCREED